MKPLGKSTKEGLKRLVENFMPRMKIFIRPYACASLEEVMSLGEELTLEENAFSRKSSTEPRWDHRQLTSCRQETQINAKSIKDAYTMPRIN